MTCPKCDDRGFIWILQENKRLPPVVEPCSCQIIKDVINNANKGWPNLIQAGKVRQSPLLGLESNNVWVTSAYDVFRSHMRYVAVRQGATWYFRVVSDSDLITSWLGSTALKRSEIFDADVALSGATVSAKMHSLVDFIDPPELLVIQLGVKSARNNAMPEVFLETLRHRAFTGKPTWVFDQPDSPFNSNHLCYSEESHHVMTEFKRLSLAKDASESRRSQQSPQQSPQYPQQHSQVLLTPASDRVTIPVTRTPTPTDAIPVIRPETISGAMYEIKTAGQKKSKRRF